MRHLKWMKAAASTAVFACLFAGTVFAADSADLSSCVVDGNQIKITGTAVHTEDETQGEAGQKTETADDGKYYLFDLMPYETALEGAALRQEPERGSAVCQICGGSEQGRRLRACQQRGLCDEPGSHL